MKQITYSMTVLIQFSTFLVFLPLVISFDIFDKFDIFGLTSKDPEENMNITEVIRYHGYPVEEYNVTTDDGYILDVFHIPHGKGNGNVTKGSRKPVFLQHGFASAASSWVVNTPDKNLAYLLADRGYDVWLGDLRGCSLARHHTTLSPEKEEFWKFSFDESAKYDIPNMVDFVLEMTGFSQLHYIGHSMGTAVAFALLSTQIEYNKKIRSLNALAPVAQLEHSKSPLVQFAATFSDQLAGFLKAIGGYEFSAKTPLNDVLGNSLCKLQLSNRLCSNSLFLLFGYDNEQFNDTRLPVYLHFYPSGTSTQTAHHLGQIYKAHRFQWYDYGEEKNQEKYNQSIPPMYDVTKITAPVALYAGQNDWLAAPEDVDYLRENIKSLILDYIVPFEKFNHVDFQWALDVIPLLYDKLFETLESTWKDQ